MSDSCNIISEKKALRQMSAGLVRLKEIHNRGDTFYDKTAAWKRIEYGWHNSLFPPEYRRYCLVKKDFIMEPSCDLYYYMAVWYQNLTFQKAPPNFEITASWKDCIQKGTAVWQKSSREAVKDLIERCTFRNPKQRAPDARNLLASAPAAILLLYLQK